MRKSEIIKQFSEAFAKFSDNPLGFVMFMFPWDSDPSIQMVKLPKEYQDRFNCEYGPDLWACEYLDQWGEEIKKRGFNGRDPVDAVQMSTASGHGIGKSVLVAWIILFIMCTRPYCKGTVTASTEPQLRTKTWAELGKWFKRSLVSDIFVYNSGRGASVLYHPSDKAEWFCQAITCREENSEAFAGQHAANSTSFYIFDEASGVPDSIWRVRRGGLTDGEPMTHDFGNPTKNTGYFYENMEGRFRRRYIRRNIDSRTVTITNKVEIQRWIEDYGIDNDEVKIRVLGQFPAFGVRQFIPTDDVMEAMTCIDLALDRRQPLTIGVDVARYGDDETVIYPRLGRDARTFEPDRVRDPNTITIANRIIAMVEKFRGLGIEYSEIFVDSTGGYGGGVVDNLREMGYHCIEVNFGRASPDPKYRYIADMIWGRLRDDIANGMCLPKAGNGIGETALVTAEDISVDVTLMGSVLAQDLFTQMTGRQFSYTTAGNKIHLEPKKEMKDRLCSPDLVDALALTYTLPVTTKYVRPSVNGNFAKHEYNPYDDAHMGM